MAKNKNKKSSKGKVAGGVGAVAVVAIAALLFGKDFGLGLGDGFGLGEGKDSKPVSSEVKEDTEEVKDEIKEEVKEENKEKKTVVIEVKQDKYFIGEAEKSLADIEALLTGEEVANTSFVLESNYAATKEWDEIKALFTQYEVDVAEQ